MAMKNPYAFRSRVSAAKTRAVVRCFAADLTALQTAELARLNRNTVNRLYRALRERIVIACEARCSMFGVVEADECYFGPRRVKGKAGRAAAGKITVFGIIVVAVVLFVTEKLRVDIVDVRHARGDESFQLGFEDLAAGKARENGRNAPVRRSRSALLRRSSGSNTWP